MSTYPFEAYVDGESIEEFFVYTEAETLSARALSDEKWSGGLSGETDSIYLNLFRTPISEYKCIGKKLDRMNGREVTMGEIETLEEYEEEEISADLEDRCFYSLIATGKSKERRKIIGGGRLSTEKVNEVPHSLTLDELKFVAIEDLDLSLDEAKDVKAQIESMGTNCSGRCVCVGFILGLEAGEKYGIMTNHRGEVSRYHNHSNEEIKKVL